MNNWCPDTYRQTWNFASTAHIGQTMPGTDVSYLNHLGNVTMEAMTATTHSTIEDPNLLIQCALLHDVIEDTDTSYEQVKNEFGEAVANGVMALTKNTALLTKPEQMTDSLNRIKQQPPEVWMVKLCDRISNLQPPPKHWNVDKIKRYQQEAQKILDALGSANQYLANRLAIKIEQYQKYLTKSE